MRRPLAWAVCGLLASAPPALAQDWTYASTEHFEVYTTGGARTARDVLTHFERVHDFFTDFLRLAPRTTAPTRLIVFSGEKEFAPYRPSEVAAAFYQPGPDRDYIVLGAFEEHANQIVIHEYAHLILKHSGHAYPLWFNEGFADFFSTMTPEGGNGMKIGLVPLHRLLYLRESGEGLMPLDTLFGVGHGSREYNAKSHAGVFYSQSWALTHMFLTDDSYRPGSLKFLQMIEAGAPSVQAIEQAFGRPLATVMRDLEGHIRRGQHKYYPTTYKASARRGRIATRDADPFEGDLVTANLLASSPNRVAEARAAFKRLASQRPDDLQLAESWAYFELRRGEPQIAAAQLERAVALGSRTPSVYRDYAAVAPDKALDLLATAVSLAPADVDMRLHFASRLVAADRNGQALATLAPVTPTRAFAFQYFQLLATVYMRLNEVDHGRVAAAAAVQHAQPGDEAAFAARLLQRIDDFIASRAAALAARAAAGADAAVPPAGTSAPDVSSIEALPYTPGAGSRDQDLTVVVAGRIRDMVCGSGPPIMVVATPSGTLRLLIDDGLKIRVVGLSSFTTDLQCGKQDVPIRIGYEPVVDPSKKTQGNVRLLDYRPQ